MTKIIVLGEAGPCAGGDTSQAPLDKTWISQSVFKPQRVGDFYEMTGPTWSQCDIDLSLADVTVEFFDVSPAHTGDPLNWVSLDKATNTIKV